MTDNGGVDFGFIVIAIVIISFILVMNKFTPVIVEKAKMASVSLKENQSRNNRRIVIGMKIFLKVGSGLLMSGVGYLLAFVTWFILRSASVGPMSSWVIWGAIIGFLLGLLISPIELIRFLIRFVTTVNKPDWSGTMLDADTWGKKREEE